ncbi:MAG: glycosyltransferase [Helicobacteraceae bacterium]|jgi:glycosyltransferase involved in cell wall biosynthesis|nr:glycosyltransferase [Helicobacteraceae bacterium]
MKFFHLINVRWYNGTAWYALNLAKMLEREGHEAIVGILPETETARYARKKNLRFIEGDFTAKNPIALINAAIRLNKFINEFQPDHITAHRGELFWFLALKRLLGGKFKLSRVRGDQRPPKANFINKFLHNFCADTIITSGAWIKDIFTRDLGTDPNKIFVIYGGVDTEFFKFNAAGREKVRAEFGVAQDETAIGIVGRYSEVKGHKSLIDALELLLAEGGRYKLLCVTDSADLDIRELREYIAAKNLTDRAFITGFRLDIAECISAFDVAVVASLGSEAICRAAFEILSCGRKLVVTTAGTLPEIAPSENVAIAGVAESLAEKIKSCVPCDRVFSEQDFARQYLAAIGAN